MLDLIPAKQKELKEFSAKYGEKELGNVTVSQVRGARGARHEAAAGPPPRARSHGISPPARRRRVPPRPPALTRALSRPPRAGHWRRARREVHVLGDVAA